MRHHTVLAALILAVLVTAGPVRAQISLPPSFGGQQGPSSGGSNPGFGPTPGYGQGTPTPGDGQGGPSLAGAWSGDSNTQGFAAHGTDFYGSDGRFVSAVQLSNGMLIRIWGHYRTSSIGSGRLLVDFQPEGSLPREMCLQQPGLSPACQPFATPQPNSLVVTFTSPDTLQGFDPQKPGQPPVMSRRDANPYLLQRQVPNQEVVLMQPPPAVSAPQSGPSRGGYAPPAPVVGGYQSPRSTGPKCDDVLQRRLCRYDGRLVSSGGCLVCVN